MLILHPSTVGEAVMFRIWNLTLYYDPILGSKKSNTNTSIKLDFC